MKKIIPLTASIIVVLVAGVFAGAGTLANFSDTETSEDNIGTAGILDLKVKGSSWDDDPVVKQLSIGNIKPGNTYTLGTFKLKNAGTVKGNLTLKIKNPVSHENSLEEPEKAEGDTWSEIDPTGYDANGGGGELWDQVTLAIWADSAPYGGAGSHSGNKQKDWDDTIFKGFSSTQDDCSSTYSISLDSDLIKGQVVLDSGDTVVIGIAIKFIDDQSGSWWGGQGNLSNNMAMSDDIEFDVEFGLVQS